MSLLYKRQKFLSCAICAILATVAEAAPSADVSFNGERLQIHEARVSAVPFNRVWPGRQRSLDQTKMSAFVGFDIPQGGGELEIEFSSGEVPEKARIRPFSREQPIRKGAAWCVRVERPEQFVVEFPETGEEMHVFADPPFSVPAGGKVRLFAPGEHHPGAIIPEDGETIVVERGATVYGNLVLTGVRDVSIVGRGIIDGSEQKRIDPDYSGVRHLKSVGCPESLIEWGSTCVFAMRCRNVKIDGVTFRDAPRWTMNFQNCDGVDIRNVKIVGMWRYNSDGIDICGCRDVRISDSFVRSFDDCVIARPPCQDMRVENCVLWCDWNWNIKVQHSEKPGTMEDIRFENIKAVNVDTVLAGVTTRYGSTNCVIRNVRLKGVEADVPPDRPKHMGQRTDDQKFVYAPATGLELLRIGAYALGSPTPNQGEPIPVDEGSLRFDYDGIVMEDVTVYSSPGVVVDRESPYRVFCTIESVTAGFHVHNVRLSGLPSCCELVEKCRRGSIGVSVSNNL